MKIWELNKVAHNVNTVKALISPGRGNINTELTALEAPRLFQTCLQSNTPDSNNQLSIRMSRCNRWVWAKSQFRERLGVAEHYHKVQFVLLLLVSVKNDAAWNWGITLCDSDKGLLIDPVFFIYHVHFLSSSTSKCPMMTHCCTATVFFSLLLAVCPCSSKCISPFGVYFLSRASTFQTASLWPSPATRRCNYTPK